MEPQGYFWACLPCFHNEKSKNLGLDVLPHPHPSNSEGQPAAPWGWEKVLFHSTHSTWCSWKGPHARGSRWTQRRPMQPRKTDSACPLQLPQGFQGAAPEHSAPAAPHHPSQSGCLPQANASPKTRVLGTKRRLHHQGGHHPAAHPHEHPRSKPEPHAHSCGDVCSEPGVPVVPKLPETFPVPTGRDAGHLAPSYPGNQTSKNPRPERGIPRPPSTGAAGHRGVAHHRSGRTATTYQATHEGRGRALPTMPQRDYNAHTAPRSRAYNTHNALERGLTLHTIPGRDYNTHNAPGVPSLPKPLRGRGTHAGLHYSQWPHRWHGRGLSSRQLLMYRTAPSRSSSGPSHLWHCLLRALSWLWLSSQVFPNPRALKELSLLRLHTL